MTDQNKEPDAFFDHFSRGDKPTQTGMKLVKALARNIFQYSQITSGGSILEIGPGRGDFTDICLEKGLEYFEEGSVSEIFGTVFIKNQYRIFGDFNHGRGSSPDGIGWPSGSIENRYPLAPSRRSLIKFGLNVRVQARTPFVPSVPSSRPAEAMFSRFGPSRSLCN